MSEKIVTVFDKADDLSEDQLRTHKRDIQKMSHLEADLFIEAVEKMLNVRMAIDHTLYRERKRAGQVFLLQEDMKDAILKRVKALSDGAESADQQRVMN